MPRLMHWCTRIDRAYFLQIKLGCYNLSMCACVCGCTNTLQEWPGNAVFYFEYRLDRTVVPFGWCPCALFIELSSTSPEAQY